QPSPYPCEQESTRRRPGKSPRGLCSSSRTPADLSAKQAILLLPCGSSPLRPSSSSSPTVTSLPVAAMALPEPSAAIPAPLPGVPPCSHVPPPLPAGSNSLGLYRSLSFFCKLS
uniref:Uncharacterized protein n=1 Tax=Triticum urartu TaxID=4572 RepID=A0A8R7TVC4_TRIUA